MMMATSQPGTDEGRRGGPTLLRTLPLGAAVFILALGWPLASHGFQGTTAARQYAEAADLQGRGDYAGAAAAWRKFIAEHASDERIGRAVHNLGVCCYQQGQYAEALAAFQKVVADHPRSDVAVSARLHVGASQFAMARAGQRELYDQAAATLGDLLEKHPQGDHVPDACYYLAEACDALGRRAEALRWYRRLVDEHPQHRFAAEGLYALALLQEETRDPAAAAKSYEQLLARFPGFRLAAEARLGAARCRVMAGQHDAAREALRQIVASGGPAAVEAAHWLAQSFLQQKQPQESLAVLDRIGSSGAKTPWAARLLADRADALAATAERRKEAISLYAYIAVQHPKDPVAVEARFRAGFVALEAGEFAAALRHANTFASEHPHHALTPDALQIAAESQLQLGKCSEAEALFGRLVREYPHHPSADAWKVRRALALHAQQQFQEVIRFLGPLVGELRAPDHAAEAHYLIGASRLALKEPNEAIRSLTAALEAQPKGRQADRACLALAEAHRQKGDWPSALAAAQRAVESFPDSPVADQALFQLGICFSLAGQNGSAVETYRRLIARWPSSPLAPLALHELGCAQLSGEDPAGAEATFTRLLEKPLEPALARKARYGRALARHQQGKSAEAAADLEALLAARPSGAEKSNARFLLGLCQAGSKQDDKAAATFGELLREDPAYAARDEALYQWAWALKRSGREAEALKAFGQLAADHPKSPLAAEALFQMAEARYRSRDYAAAADAYYSLVMNRPAAESFVPKAAWRLAQCYYAQGKFADAGRTFAYYRAKHPDGAQAAEAAWMEAECLFKQGMAAESLAAYAALKPPADGEARAAMFLHAGQAAAQLGRWAESAAWLERLARELPDAPVLSEAFCELGVARQNLGDLAGAVAAYQEAIAKGGGEPAARAQFLLGKIQRQQDNRKEAIASFLKTAYGYSYPKWQAMAVFEAARCHEELDQKSQAIGLYQQIVERFPKSEQAAAAEKRLAELTKEK